MKNFLELLTSFWTRLYYKMSEETLKTEVVRLRKIICDYISELRKKDRDQDKIRVAIRELTNVYEEENEQSG